MAQRFNRSRHPFPQLLETARLFSERLYQQALEKLFWIVGRLVSRLWADAKAARRSFKLFVIDLVLAGLSLILATVFRFGFASPFNDPDRYATLISAVPIFAVICAVVFPTSGLYRRNWRYASIGDLATIVRASVAASICFVFCMFLFSRLEMIPRSVVAIEILILIPSLSIVRLRSRFDELKSFVPPFKVNASHSPQMVPILLIGANNAADLYLRALQRDPSSQYCPVGFLDNALDQQGLMIRGVPILGTLAEFDTVLRTLEVGNQRPRHIIFTDALSRFGEKAAEDMIDRAERLGIAISRLTPPTQLRNPRTAAKFEVRPIELTDLLERPQAALDRNIQRRLIAGRRVLVTGAGGSIGSELTQQIAALEPAELILIDSCEYNLYAIDLELSEKWAGVRRVTYLCNIREAGRVDAIFARHRPELVFHAAALKHVPMVELNPCEGVLTNVIGTMHVASAAKRTGALAMVQVSTDKVVNSTNVMGATKRLAELYCQALEIDGSATSESRFMTVRFGNVLGSSGSLIPLFQRQIMQGGPLTVTHPEIKRFFMTIREAVELTLQASACGLEQRIGRGEIFVLDMGEPIRIVDIARRMIKLAGYTPDKDIKVKIVGLRPGEKLYEELFDSLEKRVDSPVPGVLGAVPDPVALPVLESTFAQLMKSAESGDVEGVYNALGELLPQYKRDERQRFAGTQSGASATEAVDSVAA